MSQLQAISEVLKENEGLEGTPAPPLAMETLYKVGAGKAQSQNRLCLGKLCTGACAQLSQAR